MFRGTDTSQLIELLNYLRSHKLNQFEWLYRYTLQELCRRQPYIAKVYMYRDLFNEESEEQEMS